MEEEEAVEAVDVLGVAVAVAVGGVEGGEEVVVVVTGGAVERINDTPAAAALGWTKMATVTSTVVCKDHCCLCSCSCCGCCC